MAKEGTEASEIQALSNEDDLSSFNRRGLFLGGSKKSGTTLILSLLDGHPKLVVLPEETHFIEHWSEYSALATYPEKLRHLLKNSDLHRLACKRFEDPLYSRSPDARDYSGFDYKRFTQISGEFVKQPGMNDSMLFSETIRAYAMTIGCNWKDCVRWVEKTPCNEVYADHLFKLFPDAKLLQMIRDPRSVFATRKQRLINRYGYYTKAHRLVRNWNRSARCIPKLQPQTDKYLLIRYEDLVQKSREVLGKVCEFIGIELVQEMFTPTRAGTQWAGNSTFHSAFKGISTQSVDTWKSELTEDEIWWIELHCRRWMALGGYVPLTDGRFSLTRWLRQLPGESWIGYLRARRASLCQAAGLLRS